jgi:hypothetical protein
VFTGFTDCEFNLRWDWNSVLCDDPALQFGSSARPIFPADCFVSYVDEFATRCRLNIRYGVAVKAMSRNEMFLVVDDEHSI